MYGDCEGVEEVEEIAGKLKERLTIYIWVYICFLDFF